MIIGKRQAKGALALALTAAMLAACSNNGNGGGSAEAGGSKGEDAGIEASGFPIVKDKIEVSGFAGKFFANVDWSHLKLWQEYEKKTNIHMNWETVQKDGLKEKRNLLLAGGNYPEVFYASSFSRSEVVKYGEQGVFLPLNDLIDKYAPNFKAIMDKYPSIKQGITMPDGNIYSLPVIYDPDFRSVFFNTPWVRTEWLQKLGIQEPQDLDQFKAMLKAFKTGDPNGNGKPDEIAWGGTGTAGLMGYLKGSFGLNNRGAANPYVDEAPANKGKIRFVAAAPEYKKLLEYVHGLYADGLIEKDIASVKAEEIDAKGTAGLLGVVDNVDPVAIYNDNGYVGLPVLKGPDGERMYTYLGAPLGGIAQFVLTDKAKNPEAMIRWMDYFYGDEGIKNFFMGWKDDTYKENADGSVEYVDDMAKNKDGLSLDQAVSRYLIWPGGLYPGYVKEKYFKGAEALPTSVANSKKADPYVLKPDAVWPGFSFTAEEQEVLSTVGTDIQTYVDEMRDKFIVGDAKLGDWDSYVSTLDGMGLKQYIEIYQAALDRNNKN
ncbi:ABC transporter, solute-binding protein [Paenibacillus sp. P22]|nr:ABC transporter, solute-binding protein [Paenibacillus sp. P22]